jgi:hypothetical protein
LAVRSFLHNENNGGYKPCVENLNEQYPVVLCKYAVYTHTWKPSHYLGVVCVKNTEVDLLVPDVMGKRYQEQWGRAVVVTLSGASVDEFDQVTNTKIFCILFWIKNESLFLLVTMV